jgi:Zn-dependent protease with chaperone function
MFGYVIYYIVALLIYSTYQPVNDAHLSDAQTIVFFFVLFLVFTLITILIFKKIESRNEYSTFRKIDHQFQSALTQQSILAVAFYAADIYVLNIVSILNRLTVFKKFPTIEALFFLLVFMSYLAVVWNYAYGPYQKIYKTGITKKEYIVSNISFALPILLPWFFVSLTVDLVYSLPFEPLKRILLMPEGQVAYFISFLLVVAIIGPAFIKRFWQCRPLENRFIRYRIESMCRNAGMDFNDILIWPLFGGKMITAGVMGLIKRFRYILVTPALVEMLEPIEIDAVIAHEIGHIKLKHLLFYLCFFVGYLIVAFALTDLAMYLFIYLGIAYGFIIDEGALNSLVISLCFSFSTILIFIIYFRYVFGYFMRNFERQADIFAYTTIGSPQPLISTFEKISLSSGQSPDKPNWHHFSIHERITYLTKCASDRIWINRHNLKIKRSFLIYLISMVMIGWMGFTVHYGKAKGEIHTSLLKKVIFERIKHDPTNADLNQILGDIYYSEKNYSYAIASYTLAIKYNPNQIQALNNLAWLYATCDDPRHRNSQKAVELAQYASEHSNKSYILDTLAEAYYTNGDLDIAVKTAEQALLAAPHNDSYYLDQLVKFKKAVQASQSSNNRLGKNIDE